MQVLGAEAFYDEYVAPTLTDFISRRFEGICRDYFSLQVRSGKLKGVRNIGTMTTPSTARTVSSMLLWSWQTAMQFMRQSIMPNL